MSGYCSKCGQTGGCDCNRMSANDGLSNAGLVEALARRKADAIALGGSAEIFVEELDEILAALAAQGSGVVSGELTRDAAELLMICPLGEWFVAADLRWSQSVGATGAALARLVERGFLERKSDPGKWGRSAYRRPQ